MRTSPHSSAWLSANTEWGSGTERVMTDRRPPPEAGEPRGRAQALGPTRPTRTPAPPGGRPRFGTGLDPLRGLREAAARWPRGVEAGSQAARTPGSPVPRHSASLRSTTLPCRRRARRMGRGLGWQRRAESHAPRGHAPRASRPLVFCCPQRPTVLPAAAAAAVGRRPSTVFSPRSAPPGRTSAAPPRGVGPPAALLRFSFMTLFSFQTFLVGAPRPSFMGRMREETQTHKSIRFFQGPLFKQFHPKPCESETLTPSHGPLGSVCP